MVGYYLLLLIRIFLFTSPIEVSYNLGIDILNRYNFNHYLPNNKKYKSFSKFKEENLKL